MYEHFMRYDLALDVVLDLHGEEGVKAVETFMCHMGNKATLRWREDGPMRCDMPCYMIAGACEDLLRTEAAKAAKAIEAKAARAARAKAARAAKAAKAIEAVEAPHAG